MNKSKGEACE